MSFGTVLALFGSAFGAAIMNALAGGGTMLTFPTLIFLGEPAIRANATSTIALLPGAAASMMGYRREVATHKEWLKTLALPSLLGGGIGSVLLLLTPEKTFKFLAPYLILFATLLFILQMFVSPKLEGGQEAPKTPERYVLAWIGQLLVAIYGGYFGAGIGILMLVILGFLGLSDIHAMNGLKNFFGMCINGVAALYFIVRGAVNWPYALVMLAGAIAGGYAGARFARRIGKQKARIAVIVIGFAIAGLLFLQRG